MNKDISYIGISGPAGAGKDEVATIIEERIKGNKKNCIVQPLAKPLKFMVYQLMDTANPGLVYSEMKEEKLLGMYSGRRLLQDLGMFFRENYTPDFWVDILKDKIEKGAEGMKKEDKSFKVTVIVPDIRFGNEARFIKDTGGIIIKVERPSLDKTAEVYQHESESGIDSEYIDHIISNNGTKRELRDKVNNLLEQIDE